MYSVLLDTCLFTVKSRALQNETHNRELLLCRFMAISFAFGVPASKVQGKGYVGTFFMRVHLYDYQGKSVLTTFVILSS